MLETIGNVANSSTTNNEARDLLAFYNLDMSKERAGIERAVLSNSFARNKFLPGMKDKFIKLITEQDSYIQSFKKSASKKMIDYYTKTLSGNAVNEVNKMRNIAKSATHIGGFEIDANYWFKRITGKINLLKKIDDQLAKGVSLYRLAAVFELSYNGMRNQHDGTSKFVQIRLARTIYAKFGVILDGFIEQELKKEE